ncbi:KorB protein [Chromobacterium sp. ATCC 53434]|uniref:H-NS histone family protein n=1 Tax=Chromobacterium sp. (strain ATCC 53434 / SC 14030) TaxID=2059672 RepID=UPI000C790514|nr:H-NS histone family protein [Chromobacterium sp. ATCC 53434]AUH49358.1 KorB protein [Chromobacterium sp. ATCC 53434]
MLDIETLKSQSLNELLSLQSQIESVIATKQKEERSEAKRQILELAKQYGLDLTSDFSQVKIERASVAVKYRSKIDPNLTWTGRGRKPVWVQTFLDNGGTLEQLSV